MQDDVKLLPCPWCGSDNIGIHKATAQCENCWVFVEEISNEAAIQAWNTRATTPQQPPTLSAEQREAIESVRDALQTLVNAAYCSPSFKALKTEINQGRVAAAKLDGLLEGNADAL